MDAAAGPVGEVSAIVSFGSERVQETATLQSLFAPGGGLNFFVNGHSPVSLEILASATVASNVITNGVPLVSTVPGAPFASIESMQLRLGETEAEEAASGLASGITLPGECAAGRSSWSSLVTFDQEGSEPEPTEQGAESGCTPRQEPLRIQRLTAAQAKQRAEEEAARKRKAEEAELVALRALVKQLRAGIARVGEGREGEDHPHGLLVTIKTSEPGIVSISGTGLGRLHEEPARPACTD